MARVASAQKNTASKAPLTGNQTTNPALNEMAEIEQLAYQFFVERDYQHGFDREDWKRAEAIVKKRKN